jgi:hypothetical protein
MMALCAKIMSNSVTPQPESPYIALARKFSLLILLMVVTVMGLVILLLQIRMPVLVLALLLTDAVIGLIAGFSVRWVLPKQTRMLQISSVLAFVVGGLALLGWFTAWRVGIGPLKTGRASVDWWELGQILLGAGSALLALYAWQRPAPASVPVPGAKPVKKLPRTRKQLQKRPPHAVTPGGASRAPSQPIQPASAMAATRPVKPKRKRLYHRKPPLQLSAEEEHRCPYCLELVEPNDPRGVVECKICHTLHHADCWAITGTCQVPHYTT